MSTLTLVTKHSNALIARLFSGLMRSLHAQLKPIHNFHFVVLVERLGFHDNYRRLMFLINSWTLHLVKLLRDSAQIFEPTTLCSLLHP